MDGSNFERKKTSDVSTFRPFTTCAGWPQVVWLAAITRRGGVTSHAVYDPEVTLFYAGIGVGLVVGGLAVFFVCRYCTRSFVNDFFDYVKKRELRKRGFKVPEGVDEEKLALIETNRELKEKLAKLLSVGNLPQDEK